MENVNYYSDQFKLRVVKEVLRGEITKEACRSKYGIKGHSTVLKWIRKFESITKDHNMNIEEPSGELERLRRELELMKKELTYERFKAKSYLEMINLAEEEFNIRIRKKSGAKLSKD